MADLSPHKMAMTFILIDSYSEKSDSSGREGGRSIPPSKKWQFDILSDRFLL